jgi:DNA polymerase/3'-5' exonuclease PolX
MTPLDASEVAKLLTEYGRRTALAGGNPYRSKAYLRAAESLAALAEPLDRIVAEGRLREISGIGEAIADIITRLHRTGTHPSCAARFPKACWRCCQFRACVRTRCSSFTSGSALRAWRNCK